MYRRVVINCIQEIGEAAVRVGDEARAKLADVPWKQIISMRNQLVHVYFNIKHRLVWEFVSRDLPSLLRSLEEALR